MELIKDLKGVTVNCGEVMVVNDMPVEVLSESISGHRDNIVNAYFMDNGKKVEVSYMSDGVYETITLYYFKDKFDNQHYRSKDYPFMKNLPPKYQDIANQLKEIHQYLLEQNMFNKINKKEA